MRQADLYILLIGPRVQEMISAFFGNLVHHPCGGLITSNFPLFRKRSGLVFVKSLQKQHSTSRGNLIISVAPGRKAK